ncbi:transporter [Aspergillus sclerotialis]|uniref:Transporter n=1 Tax=Aspergillus sclerotialis TaxID=2070753 RepID=A0A3A2ZGB9_9EURO|nr:transporter [Aspergillus sclerotialis]
MTLMKDRAVWAPLGNAVSRNFGYHLQSNYLYTMLVSSFDFGVTAAIRISSLFMFVLVVAGPLLGLVISKVRRLKLFIIFGTAVYMVGFGLLIRYRGSGKTGNRHALGKYYKSRVRQQSTSSTYIKMIYCRWTSHKKEFIKTID